MKRPRSITSIATPAQRAAIAAGADALVAVADTVYRRTLRKVASSATAAARAGFNGRVAK